MEPLRIVLLGPPASGKGTQGRRLAENLNLGYLSTGAVLREQVENQTELGKTAKPFLDRGQGSGVGRVAGMMAVRGIFWLGSKYARHSTPA